MCLLLRALTTNKGTIETGPWFDRSQHGRTGSEHLRLPALVGSKRVKQLGLIACLMEASPQPRLAALDLRSHAATQPRDLGLRQLAAQGGSTGLTRRFVGSPPQRAACASDCRAGDWMVLRSIHFLTDLATFTHLSKSPIASPLTHFAHTPHITT